jgi:hypothetical protein
VSLSAVDQSTSLQAVRETVRQILTGSEDYQRLDPSTRRDIAQGLVKICSTALDLNKADVAAGVSKPDSQMPLAFSQSAGS